ncbi:MAG TPA: hypothetical protein PKM25_09190, partial [Candidatus Ozemobacteraceae bacterium]|nr:hypothetical protein [Candidatus Ozemobacteraceae bacterium]
MNLLRRLFVLSLLPILLGLAGFMPLQAASAGKSSDTAFMARLPGKADELLVKTAVILQNRIEAFAGHLNAGTHVRLNIGQGFYDRSLRRLFVTFDGAATFSGKLPFADDLADRSFTSDSDIAWDLTLFAMQRREGNLGFRFQGDVVVFLDRLVYDLSKEFIDIAGGLAFQKAGETILTFVTKFDTRLAAKAVTKTLTSFSKESLSTTGAELVANAVQHDSDRIRDLAREAVQNGSFADFCCVAILRAGIDQTGGLIGATLGAAVGSVIAPGAGSVVGAFVGSRISKSIAHNISYRLTVEAP